MTMCLRDEYDKIGFIRDSLVMNLCIVADGDKSEQKFRRGQKLKELDRLQKQDIAAFLQHQLYHWALVPISEKAANFMPVSGQQVEDSFAREALDSYWYQFLPLQPVSPQAQ